MIYTLVTRVTGMPNMDENYNQCFWKRKEA
jgi:hypothetical protein